MRSGLWGFREGRRATRLNVIEIGGAARYMYLGRGRFLPETVVGWLFSDAFERADERETASLFIGVRTESSAWVNCEAIPWGVSDSQIRSQAH